MTLFSIDTVSLPRYFIGAGVGLFCTPLPNVKKPHLIWTGTISVYIEFGKFLIGAMSRPIVKENIMKIKLTSKSFGIRIIISYPAMTH